MASPFDGMMSEFIAALSSKYSLDESDLKATLAKVKNTPAQAPTQAPAMKPSSELMKLTKVELIEHCKSRGHKTTGTKADLIERLTGGAPVPAPPAQKKTTPTKTTKTSTVKQSEPKSGIPPALKEMIKPVSYRITKNEFGNFYHSETGLVYDRDLKKFVGKQRQDGRVDQLSDSDIETCHRYSFPYILPENLTKSETKVAISELEDELGEGEEEEIEEEDPDDAGEDVVDDIDGLDADE